MAGGVSEMVVDDVEKSPAISASWKVGIQIRNLAIFSTEKNAAGAK